MRAGFRLGAAAAAVLAAAPVLSLAPGARAEDGPADRSAAAPVEWPGHGIDHCGLEDPEVARLAPPVPRRPGASRWVDPAPFLRELRAGPRTGIGTGAAGGALAGKTVYVSAGHGWVWNATLASWRTQRGNTHDLVEDFISAETVSHYLIRYLQNMGAYVVTVREPDLNPVGALVDDASDGFAIEGELAVTETGAGYGVIASPIVDQANPFTAGGALELEAAPTETGRASWTFDVPADGDYEVYVGYVQHPSRASDAHYIVRHAGGETHFRLDQRRHGSTWVRLGRFRFEAGASPERGAVVLANDSADSGATLSADVARLGGGVGRIDRGGGTHARPMFEHAARYYAQLAGAPASVYDYASTDGNDDVGTRSRFAAWDHEDGEDAVYVAWHTNAPSPARGTSSFAYGPSAYGPLSEFSGVPGSLELMDAIHQELVADLRAGWEPGWQDRGQHTAYFGEVNPNHNPKMPATLIEVAFHDTAADADALRDPRFRRLAARAMAQGVARYFATRDGRALVLPPEPPSLLVMAPAQGQLHLRWAAPAIDAGGGDEATGYRVYLSRDGLGFDAGRDVTETSLVLDAPADGGSLYARVTATNAGGESLPSSVVGARPGSGGGAQVLVVDGFQRLDRFMVLREDLSAHALAAIDRVFVDRMNDGSHVARHGAAIAKARVSFASASAEAVGAGEVRLDDYRVVDWFAGEESTSGDPLPAAARGALEAFVSGGGKLLMSGAELAWALDFRGSDEDRAFYQGVLRALYVADDAETYAVTPVAGAFAEVGALTFDDHGPGSYDADFPDVLAPGPGAEALLEYDGGIGGIAATWWSDDASGAAVVTFGFPFETIAGADARARLMGALLAAFGVEPDGVEEPVDPGNPGDGAGPGGDLSGGCGCTGGGPAGLLGPLAAALVLARRRRRAAGNLPRT